MSAIEEVVNEEAGVESVVMENSDLVCGRRCILKAIAVWK